jgi:hypothetical protein
MSFKIAAFTVIVGLALQRPATAQVDQILAPMGGALGTQFFARCQRGDILTGFEIHAADDVDSIRPICVDPNSFSAIGGWHLFSQSFGGYGGVAHTIVCPTQAPAIAGFEVGYEGQQTIVINNIHLFCSIPRPNVALTSYPTVVFDGPVIGSTSRTPFTGWDSVLLYHGMQTCPLGLMPVGISGRSGFWLDAVGLICGAPPAARPAPTPAKTLGRVNKGPTQSGPPLSICDTARDARARNSPAAPNLEAQCQALPAKTLGRLNPTAAAPAPSHSICDAARDALSRNSPAAPNLVSQCRNAGGLASASPTNAELEIARARGESIANNDEAASELRLRTPTALVRRGFEIGLGSWDQQTAPGPGKQRYHDALTLPEQQGFDLAAAYALPHNKNAALLNAGVAIAAADLDVEAARKLDSNAFYWLGFDIASGLFGDPAAGAQGRKALDADESAIRASLNEAAQRGFNASMALHLARNYP